MGNIGSTGGGNGGRRRNNSINNHHHHHLHPTLPPPPSPLPPPPPPADNRYVFATATPYPAHYPNLNNPPQQHHHHPQYYHHQQQQYGGGGYFHPRQSFNPQHQIAPGLRGYHVPPPPPPPPLPYFVEHQKAVTIRNDVNLKKETLRVVPDQDHPGKFLVAFTFDATTPGCITVLFFAKETVDCNLVPVKENLLEPVTISFNEGLGQKFQQQSGTGIDFSMFEESELIKDGEMEVYPLAVRAEAFPIIKQGAAVDDDENDKTGTPNSQITHAVFEKRENGEYHVRVVKQILWVNSTRYELQEIYGIGNSADGDFDGNDPGKECVICLSEPRDTTVLPCRHMCLCSECAKVLRFQTNRCPICRQPVKRLLEIKLSNNSKSNSSSSGSEEQQEAPGL